MILGPANCGKTMIGVALCSLRGPYGTVRACHKGNNFPFESITNQCSVMIDEADIDEKFHAQVKDLAGGNGGGYLPQKGKQGLWTKNTPMFLTSNKDKLFDMEEEVWSSRSYQYVLQPIKTHHGVWTEKTRNHKLHPWAFRHIFKKHKLL